VRIYRELISWGIEYGDCILVHRKKRTALRELGLPLVARGPDAIRATEDTTKLLGLAIGGTWTPSVDA
jgi:hypothetical protein